MLSRLTCVLVAVACCAAGCSGSSAPSGEDADPRASGPERSVAVDEATIRSLCAECHVFPEPEILPRERWGRTIDDMWQLPSLALVLQRDYAAPIDPDAVRRWFDARAPERLGLERRDPLPQAASLGFERRGWTLGGQHAPAAVAHVQFVDIGGDERLELLVCEMRAGVVLLGRPYEPGSDLEVLMDGAFPAHAEVTDLDADGRGDVVVADLGSFYPADHTNGSVRWLRRSASGDWQTVVLDSGLGRVADVQPADFDGDGDLDLAVAEFGWRVSGHVLVLENQTLDWEHPYFVRRYIDGRHGATDVPVADFNGDGRPDFAALLSQEHELVAIYVNQGNLRFEVRDVYQAPHPHWGSNGLEPADLDGDGDLDMVVTNGDAFDEHYLKPYHSVVWLENRGALSFAAHAIAPLYGVHPAAIGDMDGDGDLDMVAGSFMAYPSDEPDPPAHFESLVWFEQVGEGAFSGWSLEWDRCTHPTTDLGDFDLDGDVDLAVGNFVIEGNERPPWVEVWRNEGR